MSKLHFFISSLVISLSANTFAENMDMKDMAGMDHMHMSDMNMHIGQDMMRSSDCSENEIYDFGMSMCMPLPMKDMPMTMLMLHGNPSRQYHFR